MEDFLPHWGPRKARPSAEELEAKINELPGANVELPAWATGGKP